jgi:tRNA(His) 5'-end guanylyltransferase
MKAQYEDRTRYMLPRRTYTIIRVDGKAFHTYTRGSEKPFDYGLMDHMDAAAVTLCQEACGVSCAYGQSDEYSFLLTDFTTPSTGAWFDGNIQKIVSVAASVFTEAFNASARKGSPHFDARVFTIPDPVEVENYFIWRQQDATRNAILMAGYSQFSPKQLHGKNTSEVQEMLFRDKGINFNDYPIRSKRGRAIIKETYTAEGEVNTERSRWVADLEMPILTQDRSYFITKLRIPLRDI